MGIGYYTLHSSCGTYLAIGQDTQYPLEGISLYKCYSGCAFQFLQVLHCTVATHWAKTRVSTSAGPLLLDLRGGRRKQFSLCRSQCTSEVHLWDQSSPGCHGSRACSTLRQEVEVEARSQQRERQRQQRRRRRRQLCGRLSFAFLRRV